MTTRNKNLFFKATLLLISLVSSIVVFGEQSRGVIAETKRSDKVALAWKRTVREFYRLRERTLDQRGTEKDVIALLALMTDNVVYEHPRANVRMTKEQAHAGMVAHLNEGKNAHISLQDIKAGNDFIVVELTLQYELPAKNGILEEITSKGMTIFEFGGDKIQRVAEY